MTFSTSDVAACCSSASSRSRVRRVSSSVENGPGWGLETLRPFRFNTLRGRASDDDSRPALKRLFIASPPARPRYIVAGEEGTGHGNEPQRNTKSPVRLASSWPGRPSERPFTSYAARCRKIGPRIVPDREAAQTPVRVESRSVTLRAGLRDSRPSARQEPLTDKLLRVRSGQKPGWGTAKGVRSRVARQRLPLMAWDQCRPDRVQSQRHVR